MNLKNIISNHAIRINTHDTLSKLIGAMQSEQKKEAYITENNDFKGVFWHDKLTMSHIDIANTEISSFIKPVSKLDENDSLQTALQKIHDADVYILPVFSKNEFKGIVHAYDIIKHCYDLDGSDTLVKNIRIQTNVKIDQKEVLGSVLKKLREHHVRELPLVDDDKNLVGKISHTGILLNYYIQHINRDGAQEPTEYTKTQTRAFTSDKTNMLELQANNFTADNKGFATFNENDTIKDVAKKMIEKESLSAFHETEHTTITLRNIIRTLLDAQTTQQNFIQFAGLNDLDIEQPVKDRVVELSEKHTEKIEQQIKNEVDVLVRIKEKSKEGNQHRYELSIRATYPGRTLHSKNEGYNLIALIRDSFEELLSEIEHAYKENVSGSASTNEFFQEITEP